MSDEKNELNVKLLSVIGLNPFAAYNSGARQFMFNSHLSQRLPIEGATERRIQTGLEQEFGKYTFNVKMPVDAQILHVIEKYPKTIVDDIQFNPIYYVIYEDINTKEISYIEIPRFKSYHTTFGFALNGTKIASQLSAGAIIPKDSILADSESVSELGGYKYGIELNVAYMSHPAVAEDGVLISEDVLERLAFKKYETRVIEFGEKYFPLNLYGDENVYKPFPDIGEYVREDSILGALREYDEDINPAIMGVDDVRKVDHIFDKCIYASSPQSRIIDIKIFYNPNTKYSLPDGMDSSLKKYVNATHHFYLKLLEIEKKLLIERRRKFNIDKLNVSSKLHRLLVEALIMTETGGNTASSMISRLHRNTPMDIYRVEFSLETRVVPTTGFKLSGTSGDKGVVCQVEKPENMPIDKDGVRADIVTDDVSTVNRMNLGRVYEQYIGRACLHIKFMLRDYLNLDKHSKLYQERIHSDISHIDISTMKQILLQFYQIVSETMFDHFSGLSDDLFIEHLAHVICEGPYLYLPPDHPKNSSAIVKDIYKVFGVKPDKVTMVTPLGEKITTVNNVLIGPVYIMLLEKIADSWSALSSGKLQHFGVLSPMTQSEKYAYPYRNSSVRTVGETEGRVYAAYSSRLNVAEVMDRNNNTLTHREVVKSIINADHPTDIVDAVNRMTVPLGSVKPLQYVKHLLFSSGVRFEYFKGN